MVFDDAPGGGAQHRMVSDYMADHRARDLSVRIERGVHCL